MNFDLADFFVRFWAENGESVIALARKLIATVLIIIIGRFFTRIVRRIIQKIKADETVISLLSTITKHGIILICLILILEVFNINTTGLIAILGTAGIAIGFALRDTLSNIAAGIVIIILKPFRKGDFVECGNITGTVREMGLFTTSIETVDGIFIFAPNSNFWGVPLRNFSRNEKRRMDITVNISFTDSIDEAFRVLSEVIKAEGRFLKDPAPQVMVQSIMDTGIGITLRAWVSADLYWVVYWDQMKNVKEKIQEAGLTIAVPRRDIRIAS